MEFRFDNATDVWHFCANCAKWPIKCSDTFWSDKLPSGFKLCDECKSLLQVTQCEDETAHRQIP